MFVDSHCHLDRLEWDKLNSPLSDILATARSKGVQHFLCVSVKLSQFDSMLAAVREHSDVSVSCGIHPLNQEDAAELPRLAELAQHPSVIAIGETGLDYYYSEDTKQLQQDAFAHHIEVAKQLAKPLIVHTRDAKADTLAMLKAGDAEQCGGVLHCFTEDWPMAKAALDMGFYISLSGIVTFKSAQALQDVAKKIPADRLLIETDSPYLAPVPYRGKTNQPAYVVEVAGFLAALRGQSVGELAKQTTDNFYRLFPLAKRG